MTDDRYTVGGVVVGAMTKSKPIRCGYCGRFIGHREDSRCQYTPDSDWTVESIEHYHISCSGGGEGSEEVEG
jgi:hypothetical protein